MLFRTRQTAGDDRLGQRLFLVLCPNGALHSDAAEAHGERRRTTEHLAVPSGRNPASRRCAWWRVP